MCVNYAWYPEPRDHTKWIWQLCGHNPQKKMVKKKKTLLTENVLGSIWNGSRVRMIFLLQSGHMIWDGGLIQFLSWDRNCPQHLSWGKFSWENSRVLLPGSSHLKPRKKERTIRPLSSPNFYQQELVLHSVPKPQQLGQNPELLIEMKKVNQQRPTGCRDTIGNAIQAENKTMLLCGREVGYSPRVVCVP